jgi:hypothetical protein
MAVTKVAVKALTAKIDAVYESTVENMDGEVLHFCAVVSYRTLRPLGSIRLTIPSIILLLSLSWTPSFTRLKSPVMVLMLAVVQTKFSLAQSNVKFTL